MQQNKNIYKISIITLCIFIGWCLVVGLFTRYDRAGFYFWGGSIFGVLSFVVTGVSLYLIKMRNSRNATEINYIPVYYTGAYLLISLIINTYFIFRLAGSFNVIVVGINVVINILFIGIRLFVNDYVEVADDKSIDIAEKIKPISKISMKLAVLLSITTNTEIKKKLYSLKELVDYSSNMSQKVSENIDNMFLSQLEEIHSLLIQNEEESEIFKKIGEATVTWKSRNSIVKSN